MSIFNPDDYNNTTDSTKNYDNIYLKKTGATSSTALTTFLNDVNLSNVNLSGYINVNNNTLITPLELSSLDGIASNIQEQINAVNSGGTILINDNVFTGKNTFNNEMVINNNIKLNNNTIIDQNELNNINGSTSNIQTQINNKMNYITSPVNNNICSMNAVGQVINNGLGLTTDPLLTINSNSLIPSSQAIKTYIDNSISNIPAQVVGESINFYFTNTDSGISNYEIIQNTPDTINLQDIEFVDVQNNRLLIHGYITQNFNRDIINAGIFNFILYASIDDNTSLSNLQVEIYKRTITGVETLILDGINTSDINTIYPSVIPYTAYATLTNNVSLNLSDELVVKIYGYTTVSNKAIRIYFYHGGNTNSFFQSPLIYKHNELYGLQGGNTNERYHLTQNQYNLATQNSNSSQTGLLLNTDWTVFNNKQNLITINTDLNLNSIFLTNYGDVKTQINSKQNIIDNTTDLIVKSININNFGDVQTKINSKQNIIDNTTDISLNKIVANFMFTSNNATSIQSQLDYLYNNIGSNLLSQNNTWSGINNFSSNLLLVGNIQTSNGIEISSIELSNLNNITSNIQTQLNGKQNTITNQTNIVCNSLQTINGDVDSNLNNKQDLLTTTTDLYINKLRTSTYLDIDTAINGKQNILNTSSNISINQLTSNIMILNGINMIARLDAKQDLLNTSTNISINNLSIGGVCQLGTLTNNLELYLQNINTSLNKYNKVLYVSKTGSDLLGDGTTNNPYLTVGKALLFNNINTTITIYIYPGIYSENLDLTGIENLMIFGINKKQVNIDGNIICNSSQNIYIQNITCRSISNLSVGDLYLFNVDISGPSGDNALISNNDNNIYCDYVNFLNINKKIILSVITTTKNKNFNNCNLGIIEVSNALVVVNIQNSNTSYINVKSGRLNIQNSNIRYDTTAILIENGGYLNIQNCGIYNISNYNTSSIFQNTSSYLYIKNVVFNIQTSTLNGFIIDENVYSHNVALNSLYVKDKGFVTKDELYYLNGVTSNIQNQINNNKNLILIIENVQSYTINNNDFFIHFENILYNSFDVNSGEYSTTTKKFTAKQNGIYRFTCCGKIEYNTNEHYIELQTFKNDNQTSNFHVVASDGSQYNRRVFSYNVVFKLNSNDNIYLKMLASLATQILSYNYTVERIALF